MLVIPVYDILLVPNATVYLQTEQIRRSAGGKGFVVDQKVILIVAKKNVRLAELTEDDFYPVGISGVIAEISPQGYVAIHTQYRVQIDTLLISPDRSIELTVSKRNDIDDLDSAVEQAKLNNLLQEMRAFASGLQGAEMLEGYISHIDSIGAAAAGLSPWLKATNEEYYEILSEDSTARRTEMLEKMLYDYLEVGRITNEAVSSQQEEQRNLYRESAIKRQMEHLQRELDEMHPERVTDIRKFEKKIAESGMNETARGEAEKVLNRLKQEGRESAETGVLYDYLDFITSLSWKKEETEYIDLTEAEKILDEDHYGLAKVKKRIIQQIAVMNLKKQQSGSILLFSGAPGTGKTSIGRSIARALGRKYVRVSLGGVHDESDIRGHRRTYIGAMPGRIMDGIQKSGVSNPVMVLDEVDKLSDSYHGSPASALLEVLDPEQNSTFTDHYMNVPYDLSNVLFICTANTTDTIPEPLLNRMEVIPFSGYTPDEKLKIAREHLVPKSMESMGISEEQMEIREEALKRLISDYTREAGVRGLRKHIDTLCRAMAVRVSAHPEEKLTVTEETVREEIETRPVQHNEVLREPRPGVVTGLAWTPVGGEILYIETLFTKGKGELTITGQLGDVMKESARIAISLVKSLFPDKAEMFAKNNLHIHVPSGAVPKDGPSAGIALSVALSSLVTGKTVDPHIAMTGEIALRGAVMPIGGLPEKLMAAQRAGVRKVLIPEENVFDLKDVAGEVKEQLEIIPVSAIDAVLKHVGINIKNVKERERT